jgi:hypothetical protein
MCVCLPARLRVGEAMDGTYRFHKQLAEQFVRASAQHFFSSGMAQRIVLHRIEREAKVPGYLQLKLSMPARDQLLKRVDELVSGGQQVQVFQLRVLAEAYGCTLANSDLAHDVRKRLQVTMKVCTTAVDVPLDPRRPAGLSPCRFGWELAPYAARLFLSRN